MSSNTEANGTTKTASHAFEGHYDAKQHQPKPEDCVTSVRTQIVNISHVEFCNLAVIEYLHGQYRLILSEDSHIVSTDVLRLDRTDVEDFYYNAYDYTDEDDEMLLYRLMTSIAIIKLFDGMRKFVGWEEV